MNPRRVHDLMRSNFKAADASALKWVNVCDEHGALLVERAREVLLLAFMQLGTSEVLVEVHRKLGDVVVVTALLSYLAEHAGKGSIRIANRSFTVFANLALNGVAAHWQASYGQKRTLQNLTWRTK